MTREMEIYPNTGGEIVLTGIEWDCESQDMYTGHDCGYEYGRMHGVTFEKALVGGLTITRDMLVAILSNAAVEEMEREVEDTQ